MYTFELTFSVKQRPTSYPKVLIQGSLFIILILYPFSVSSHKEGLFAQTSKMTYAIFSGFDTPLQPKEFQKYYLAGLAIGGEAERSVSKNWKSGVRLKYALYEPNNSEFNNFRDEYLFAIEDDASYKIHSYAVTALVRREWGDQREDIRYYSSFEIGPHRFTGSGLSALPKEVKSEVTLSDNNIRLGYGLGMGIKWVWDKRYATFIEVSWHKLLNDPRSKSSYPLLAGIRF